MLDNTPASTRVMSSTLIPANGNLSESTATVARRLFSGLLKPLERYVVPAFLASPSMGFLATMAQAIPSLKLVTWWRRQKFAPTGVEESWMPRSLGCGAG